MQELQVNIQQAQIEIASRESFEQGINEVVEKYNNYAVTASTVKDDKKVLADLRKLEKQISDERIKIKRELSQPADDFDSYIKTTAKPLSDIIGKIAMDIKEFEEHQKSVRIDAVKNYIANKASEVMLDPRIFDEQAQGFVKASDFMADGYTLKKATMKSLDEIIASEYQSQQELEKAKAMISGQCAEYGMTDQPYIRMLKDLTTIEVLQQIKSDYLFNLEKEKVRQTEERLAAERAQKEAEEKAKAEAKAKAEQTAKTPIIDLETGEIMEDGRLHQEQTEAAVEVQNEPKKYTQKMTLEVYFEDSEQKELFKSGLADLGFEYKKNYQVSGYQNIKPLTQEELDEQFGQ